MIIGMIYAGYVPFVISTRNNAAAITHLLSRTKARHLLVSRDASMQALAKAALEELEVGQDATRTGKVVDTYAMPIYEDFFGDSGVIGGVERFEPVRPKNLSDPLFIMHSSGTSEILNKVPHECVLDCCLSV